MQLAALAVFRTLYDSKKDIFIILSEFIKECVASRNVYTVTPTQVADFLKEDYGFQIPEAVISTVLSKFTSRENGIYCIPNMTLIKDSLFTSRYESIKASNNTIINELITFVEDKECKKLTDTEKEELTQSFCAFLLDEESNTEYSTYISAFIVKGKQDTTFTQKLNTIKEGVVLYSGIWYNDNLNEVGSWSTPLTIYVEHEILFHFAGYNGTLYKNLFEDFYNLVREININNNRKTGKPLIRIKYFPEVKADIDLFFKRAEQIVDSGEMHDSSKTAMVSIVSGCETSADVIQKKANFETLLQTNGITQEEQFNFYEEEDKKAYNFESEELLANLASTLNEDDIYPHLKYLYYINVLRQGKKISQFEKSEYILLTGNGKTMSMAYHPQIKLEGGVPLATYLTFITSKLWFKLNKGFGNGNYPKSFDIVTKAQMVLAAHLNNSVSEEYQKINQKFKNGELNKDSATRALAELKNRARKPEDIKQENVEEIVQLIKNNDVEICLREREIEHRKVQEQKQQISDLMRANELQQASHDQEMKTQKRNELNEILASITDIEIRKQVADKNINSILFRYKCIPIGLFLLYLVIMAILTYIYSWNIIEPYTFFGGGIWGVFIYAYLGIRGHSFNPFKFVDKKYLPLITKRMYKKHFIDIARLCELHKKKEAIEAFFQ